MLGKTWEEDLLDAVPARLAGPVVVTLCTFGLFTLLWMLLAKRTTPERVQEASKKAGSIRTVKAEMATRVVSIIHATIVAQAG